MIHRVCRLKRIIVQANTVEQKKLVTYKQLGVAALDYIPTYRIDRKLLNSPGDISWTVVG